MEIIKYLSGPLIGAVIGYFTNLIAVKMLFYPRKQIYIFGHKLPFTPGAIPKEKPRIAKAVGNVIENNLLTKQDIFDQLLSDKAEQKVADIVTEQLSDKLRDKIQSLAGTTDEQYDRKKAKLSEFISWQIVNTLSESNISATMLDKAAEIIKQKTQGSMLAMFINDDTIKTITQPMSEQLDYMITQKGIDYIQPIVQQKLYELENNSGTELLQTLDISEDAVRAASISVYRQFISSYSSTLLNGINILSVVQNKIDNMSVDELEKLVLEVMKKELDTIVSLGALIGFIIGLINIII